MKVTLPDTLITNHKIDISFRALSKVTLEVITQEKLVLHRILSTLISLIIKE